MEINYELKAEDYINYNLHHIEDSPSQRKTINLLRFVVPLVFSVFIYFVGTSLFKQPAPYWVSIAVLFIVVWIVVYPKWYKRIVKSQTEKLLREGDNTSLFGKKKMIITDDTITITDRVSSEIISKNSIKTVKVYDDMILIYLSAVTAHIIPIRDLDGEMVEALIMALEKAA